MRLDGFSGSNKYPWDDTDMPMPLVANSLALPTLPVDTCPPRARQDWRLNRVGLKHTTSTPVDGCFEPPRAPVWHCFQSAFRILTRFDNVTRLHLESGLRGGCQRPHYSPNRQQKRERVARFDPTQVTKSRADVNGSSPCERVQNAGLVACFPAPA